MNIVSNLKSKLASKFGKEERITLSCVAAITVLGVAMGPVAAGLTFAGALVSAKLFTPRDAVAKPVVTKSPRARVRVTK